MATENQKIEVLHFGISSNLGGIETYIANLWKYIDRSRYHFNFIDMTGMDQMPSHLEEFREDGCGIYKITPRRISVSRNRKDLEALFQNHHFDILHFHACTLSYITPILIALKNGCRVVVHSHSSADKNVRSVLFHEINKLRLMNKKLMRVACSDKAAVWLFGNKNDVKIYNNGVDIERFRFDEKVRQSVRASVNCTDKLVIGHVGVFRPVKNHRFIVEIFEQIAKKCGDAVLWLVGEGSESEAIRSLAFEKGLGERVIFWGLRHDIPDLCCGMDLFLFPSILEGFPISLVEAQCSGLSCLVSNTISKQVYLSDYIQALPLNLSASKWADLAIHMATQPMPDRRVGADIIRRAGLSIHDEIKKIEQLYGEA